MMTFVLSIVALILGCFFCGRFVERIFDSDDRPTPAVAQAYGLDCIVLPPWKVFLIPACGTGGGE